jgi:TRAP-type C4-dicarboxylate transport system substrate-binding protein
LPKSKLIQKEERIMKKLIYIVAVGLTGIFFFMLFSGAVNAGTVPKKLHWDISVFGGPRFLTYPIDDWAKDIMRETDGRWEVQIHYGSVLATAKDGPNGLKSNLFEGCLTTSMNHPGQTPLLSVFNNPFFATRTVRQCGEWFKATTKHPAIVKELEGWNAKIMFPCPLQQYNFMGRVPIKTVEDFKGLRVRLDKAGGRPLEAFGATLVNMPATDIYSALEKGMLDVVCMNWTSPFGAFKLYELSKYATIGVDLKVTDMWFLVNKKAWDKLPEEWKKIANESAEKAIDRYVKVLKADDKKWLPLFEKAGIEIFTFPESERMKLVEKSKESWEDWIADVSKHGKPAREVMKYAAEKRDEVMKKYGE